MIIKEKAADYLRCEQKPVKASELAEQVLGLKNVTHKAAVKIISSLLETDDRFKRIDDDHWEWVESGGSPFKSWNVVKVFSSPTFLDTTAIYLAQGCETEIFATHMFSPLDEEGERIGNQINDRVEEKPLFMEGGMRQPGLLQQFIRNTIGRNVMAPVFYVDKLVRLLNADAEVCKDHHRINDLSYSNDNHPEKQFEQVVEKSLELVEALIARGIQSITELIEFYNSNITPADFLSYAFDADFISNLPRAPGIYIMKNEKGEIVYVGKAKSLFDRVRTYFSTTELMDEKIETIRRSLYTLEIIRTGSELEALLLEHEWIKENNPAINRQIQVHPGLFLQKERYPRIVFLPSSTEGRVVLMLISPGKVVKTVEVDQRAPDLNSLKKEISAIFFRSVSAKVDTEKEEIVIRWLSQHSEGITSLDMRSLSTIDETLSLVKQYISSFSPDEAVIHI